MSKDVQTSSRKQEEGYRGKLATHNPPISPAPVLLTPALLPGVPAIPFTPACPCAPIPPTPIPCIPVLPNCCSLMTTFLNSLATSISTIPGVFLCDEVEDGCEGCEVGRERR